MEKGEWFGGLERGKVKKRERERERRKYSASEKSGIKTGRRVKRERGLGSLPGMKYVGIDLFKA